MLSERGDAEALPMPETVQGIIAARLDALPTEEKSLLQNAAVLGKVFWLGALIQEGGLDHRTAKMRLHALERKDFVQRARRSSVANQAEYAFLHALVRDVAYGQIPRGRRAEQHGLAAEWIGALGRTEDHAKMLAHHFLSALELRRAAGQPVDPAFAERALSSLSEAGDRALSLNAYKGAASFYQSALELASVGSPDRAQLLFQLGQTRLIGGDGPLPSCMKTLRPPLHSAVVDVDADAATPPGCCGGRVAPPTLLYCEPWWARRWRGPAFQQTDTCSWAGCRGFKRVTVPCPVTSP